MNELYKGLPHEYLTMEQMTERMFGGGVNQVSFNAYPNGAIVSVINGRNALCDKETVEIAIKHASGNWLTGDYFGDDKRTDGQVAGWVTTDEVEAVKQWAASLPATGGDS